MLRLAWTLIFETVLLMSWLSWTCYLSLSPSTGITQISFHAIAPSDIIIFYRHFSKILHSCKDYSVLGTVLRSPISSCHFHMGKLKDKDPYPKSQRQNWVLNPGSGNLKIQVSSGSLQSLRIFDNVSRCKNRSEDLGI